MKSVGYTEGVCACGGVRWDWRWDRDSGVRRKVGEGHDLFRRIRVLGGRDVCGFIVIDVMRLYSC